MRLLLLLAVSYFYLYADARVFVYHRFGDDQHPSTNVSINELTQQFEYLKNHHYKVVKLEDIIQRLKQKEPIPDNWVALTIDDSYKSFFTNGLPVFKQYNYPFTLFVYVQATQEQYSDFMSWEELKEIRKYGDVQLHSYAHHHMTRLEEENIHADTQKAYDLFTKNMGFEPSMYAHAYGEYDEKVQKVIRSFPFDAILNQSNGSINEHTDIYNINRIPLVGTTNLEEKLKYRTFKVEWIEPKQFPLDSVLKQVKANVDKKIKEAKLYVTGHGWRDIQVNDGIIDVKLNLELKKDRIRVIIGSDYFTISNKLIIRNKEKFNVK